jgi:hypothetical protein
MCLRAGSLKSSVGVRLNRRRRSRCDTKNPGGESEVSDATDEMAHWLAASAFSKIAGRHPRNRSLSQDPPTTEIIVVKKRIQMILPRIHVCVGDRLRLGV